MKKGISFFLSVVLLLTLLPGSAYAAESGMGNFQRNGSYYTGLFTDIPADAWYADGVAAAYELGLMVGSGQNTFSPNGTVTLAEAVAMAARIHSRYGSGLESFAQGSPWYQVYVDYAVNNGLLPAGEFSDFTVPATRGQLAHILAAALPASELAPINSVPTLPDVDDTTPYHDDIFLLYRAGVLTGNDSAGTFTPNAAITRCEVATIAARMVQPDARRHLAAQGGAIQPLGLTRQLVQPQAVDGVEPYSDHYFGDSLTISADLSGAPALAYSLTFSDRTKFPAADQLPAGYDPEALLEWGKAPGLNVDILHEHGFTGEGAVIAYVDQPIGSYEQTSGINLHYVNNSSIDAEMHGPAVLSLLADPDIGTAPGAEVYYYAHAAWKADQTTHAECLYQIIEQNKSLPEGEKITMVGFSDNIDVTEANAQAFRDAVAACEDAGIMVWFCGEYASASFLPFSDKNSVQSVVPDLWYGNHTPELVFVPASGRTTATTMSGASYIYWSSGGLSWTMPYMLGLYAIAIEIDPALTQDELRTLVVETAYDNNGMKIVNPVGFIASVLEGVGRSQEAEAMLRDVAARTRYLYAVMDTAAMTQEDLNAVGRYLASITDATVLVADASSFSNAEQLYTALQADAAQRGGTVAGVQIFGTPSMVPAFRVNYKVQMQGGVDDSGDFLTDLFYGNFDNDADTISNGYSVMDHFEQGWDVTLVPQWPVARLPLSKGQFTAFFDKYDRFARETGLTQLELVNFSNPIFAQSRHSDDMGRFLNRMHSEFDLLDVPYRLYGNLDGQYPVTTKVLGNFTLENLAAETRSRPVELLINSHGQWDNIDQCIYVDGEEQRISLLNMDNINTVLNGAPYYLDCWTCLNGYEMENNLTTTALNGQCVGMFSATAVISNNGVNCDASLSDMAKSNFYYFYYSYLKALHEGQSRSQAFFTAQQAYGEALLADSANPLRGEGNYQFNLCNLLTYHNFGVLEPNASASFEANGYIAQAGQSVPKESTGSPGHGTSPSGTEIVLTDGNPVGEPAAVEYAENNMLQSGSYTIHGVTAQRLDNGYTRYTIDYTAPAGMSTCIFSPPNGDLFKIFGPITTGARETLIFDLEDQVVEESGEISISFNFNDDDRFFVFI